MDQQEFVPGSQGQGTYSQGDKDTIDGSQSFYRPKKQRTGDTPKNEHPSTFESYIPPYSYQAQDSTQQKAQHTENTKRQQEPRQRQHFSADGDAMEHGYRPYAKAFQQVPSWARPQHNNRHIARWVIAIMIGVVFIKPIIALVLFLLAALAGVAFFVLIVPILIILFLLMMFAVIAFVIFFLFIRKGRVRRRGGPWMGIMWDR